MAEEKKKEVKGEVKEGENGQNNRRPRKRKNKVTKKVEILKEIYKKGTNAQKKALDDIIADYQDYCNLPNLENQYKELGDKIRDIKAKNAPNE